jgi:hypothetical protein
MITYFLLLLLLPLSLLVVENIAVFLERDTLARENRIIGE